jgi:hypothetical protein
MSLGIKHLSQSITPDTCGIIWLSDESLNYQSPGFYEFNYLLNGILAKNLDNLNSKSDSSLFMGESFGAPFFIGHCVISSKDKVQNMYKLFQVAKSALKDGHKIFIFNRSKNTANINVLKELSKKYNQYQFENLNI